MNVTLTTSALTVARVSTRTAAIRAVVRQDSPVGTASKVTSLFQNDCALFVICALSNAALDVTVSA